MFGSLLIQGPSIATYAKWATGNASNPPGKSSNFTLSGGNLTATSDNTPDRGGSSDLSRAAGLNYAEIRVTTVGLGSFVGVGSSSWPTGSANNLQDGNGWFFHCAGKKAHGGPPAGSYGAWSNGDYVGIAWDADSGKLWFHRNGTYIDSGNPAAGTNPSYTSVTGTLYLIYGTENTGSPVFVLNSGATAFNTAQPSGFRPGWGN